MRHDQIEFSFLFIRGRAQGRYGITIFAGLMIAAIAAALFILV